jgi:hypothetical protein
VQQRCCYHDHFWAIADKNSSKTMPSDTIHVFVVSYAFVGLFHQAASRSRLTHATTNL